MLALMQRNVHLNGLEADQVRASVLNWGEDCPVSVPADPDVILAADCVYFEPAFPLLLQTLQMLIGPKTICFFCFKKRRRADMQFMKAARKSFVIQDVEDDPDRDVYKRENITLYVLVCEPCVVSTDRPDLGARSLRRSMDEGRREVWGAGIDHECIYHV
nr:protein-lysine N-methyltransferase EFM6-like [Quercus suber]